MFQIVNSYPDFKFSTTSDYGIANALGIPREPEKKSALPNNLSVILLPVFVLFSYEK